MELTPTQKFRLAATGMLLAAWFLGYMFTAGGPAGPTFRGENLNAGIPPMMLLMQDSVRSELKITEDQIQELMSNFGGPRGGMGMGGGGPGRGPNDQDNLLSTVLDAGQLTRLNQIRLQRQGGLILRDKAYADKLGLTEDQRKKISEIVENLMDQPIGKGADARSKVNDTLVATGQKAIKLLTPQQLETWNSMVGEPFKGEITFGFGRAGGGGPPMGPFGGPKGGPPNGP